MNNLSFAGKEHEDSFSRFAARMKSLDVYHLSAAYLLGLDKVLREHASDVFDFEDDSIIIDGLHKGFQTSSSSRTTRLLFNLWNGYAGDEEDKSDNPCEYSVATVFGYGSEYEPYYWQAIKLRFAITD